jgi:Putative bacterial sensory transduction regulator
MSSSIKEIAQLVRELELHYWLSGAGDQLMIPYFSNDCRQRIEVEIALQNDGTFLQFHAMILASLGPDQSCKKRAMQTLNIVNTELRFIKCFHDQADQSLRAFGDYWILDGQLTPRQFQTMLNSFSKGVLYAQAKVMAMNNDRATVSEEQVGHPNA